MSHVSIKTAVVYFIGRACPCKLFNLRLRDVFPVVRDSRMWCLHDIGRDSWVWGEQETLYSMNSPHEVGEEALSGRLSVSGGNGVALG